MLKGRVEPLVQEELSKAKTLEQNEVRRMRVPYGFNQYQNGDYKYGASVPFSYLRRMATTYPIARACINRRIRQITQLDWEITTVDEIETEKGFENQIDEVTAFFKQPMGHKTRMRELLTIVTEDLLTLDAICFELQKQRGGRFMYLVPVDPATIVLRLTEQGMTPEPPEPAYVQFIEGKKIAEFTTDEMIYDFMGARSYSPYGLAPLESLIIQVESALRGGIYNLNFFKEGNTPEGFITLPEDVASNKDQIEEWQNWFDAMMAGDPRMTRRLKILPEGSEYTPTKKPEDMAFEKFELWLLQQTCAVFDVQPQDIGITYQVNKATGDTQQKLGDARGLYPLANFHKEIYDDLIQVEMGFTNLQFVWRNINPVDRKLDAEVAKIEVEMGALSPDEYRQEHGKEAIGLGQYLKVGNSIVLVSDFLKGISTLTDSSKNEPVKQDPVDPAMIEEKMQESEIRKWKKCVLQDLERGKPIRTIFKTNKIDSETHAEISNALSKVHSKLQARILFDQYLNPELKTSMKLLKIASDMRKLDNEELLED